MGICPEALANRLKAMQIARDWIKTHQRNYPYEWYDWQKRELYSHKRQTMLLAGNQVGKSLVGTYHFAVDLTQDYPEDWEGFKFNHAINSLIIGVDNDQLEVVQTLLFGRVIDKKFEGGWVHPDEIHSIVWSRNISNIANSVNVKGKYGLSTVNLRAYSQIKTGQGTLKFAGKVFDLIYPDEQPPDELVGQLNVRLLNGNMGKGGRIRYTMTPELGKTKLIQQFMDNTGKNQELIGPVSWDECSHMTQEAQEAALEGIPEFEHDLRRQGVPSFGSGMVYAITEDRIRCDPFSVADRPWMRRIRAIDLGIRHPTAIAWIAYDPEDDTIYVVKTYSVSGEPASVHAAAANSMWKDMPLVFPHDVDTTEKGSGKTVREYYEDAGIDNAVDFKMPDGSIKVEPGIIEIYDRMRTGRFKVFSTCEHFWHEFRLFHRDKGKIIKENDDVMDAVRYGSNMVIDYGERVIERRNARKVIRAMA